MGENEDVPSQPGGDGEGASTGGKKGRYRRDKPWVGSGVPRGVSNFFLFSSFPFTGSRTRPDAAAQAQLFLLFFRAEGRSGRGFHGTRELLFFP